jgi:hypothetical protein
MPAWSAPDVRFVVYSAPDAGNDLSFAPPLVSISNLPSIQDDYRFIAWLARSSNSKSCRRSLVRPPSSSGSGRCWQLAGSDVSNPRWVWSRVFGRRGQGMARYVSAHGLGSGV